MVQIRSQDGVLASTGTDTNIIFQLALQATFVLFRGVRNNSCRGLGGAWPRCWLVGRPFHRHLILMRNLATRSCWPLSWPRFVRLASIGGLRHCMVLFFSVSVSQLLFWVLFSGDHGTGTQPWLALVQIHVS